MQDPSSEPPPTSAPGGYDILADVSPVGIFYADATGSCTRVNRRWCEMTALEPDQAAGRGWLRAIHVDDRERVALLWDQFVGSRKSFRADCRCGLERISWVQCEARAVIGTDGKLSGHVGTFTDITPLKQYLEELEESSVRTRTIITQMPVLLFAFDENGRMCAWNREAERVTGYPAEALIGQPDAMEKLCPDPHYRRKMLHAYRERGDDYLNWEWELTARDGSVRTIAFSNISEKYPIEGWANWGIGVDITARKNSERALRERVKELNCLYQLSLLSNQPDLDLDLFLQRAVELLPPCWQFPEITGARITLDEKVFEAAPFPPGRQKLTSAIQVRGRKRGVIEVCYTEMRPDADEGPFLNEERQLLDEVALRISRTIGHAMARKDLAVLDELSAKAKELEQFSHTVSHDLKTPLTAISGFAAFLSTQLNQGNLLQARACSERIIDITRRMESRLNDILKLAKVGHIIDPTQQVDVGGIIEDTLRMMAERLDKAGVTVEVAPDFPRAVADPERLREVIENLLQNAVRYIGRPPNRIVIGWRRDRDETVFYVRDNGIGIEPQYFDTIFELFRRLDPRTEGDGIGLAVARRIIEAHGGRIWVESEGRGTGSCFCFTLGQILP